MSRSVKFFGVAGNSKSWQLTAPTAAAIWAVVVAAAALDGVWHGLRGTRFVIALGVAAALFAFELLLAVPPLLGRLQGRAGAMSRIVAPLIPLFAVLVYAFGVGGNARLTLVAAAYTLVPALLLASGTGKSPGTWEDYVAVALIWLPVEFRWMYRLFPYPLQLTHTLTILTALSTGVAAFVFFRRLDGVGYGIEWRRGFARIVGIYFVIFAAIAVPLGIKIGFLTFDPTLARVRSLPLSTIAILFFTAWPEEFLFRGLLQNLFSRTFQSEWAGLIVASAIFGFSHIFHAPYPNWKYVGLATIAGLFYGRAWMKTRSLVPGTLIHALVDITWHVLFR